MIALDTNLLLRFALQDHAVQSASARRLLERQDCFASLLAMGEMGHVLMSVYRATRAELLTVCNALLALPSLEVEHEARLTQALDGFAAGIDWFDALLWAATPPGITLATFDRPFAKRAIALGWDVENRRPKTGP